MVAGAAALLAALAAGDGRAEAPPRHRVTEIPAAGPALDGRAVVWGEEYADGSLAVIRRRAGGRPRVLTRIPGTGEEDRYLSFSGLAGGLTASDGHFVYGLLSCTLTRNSFDSVSSDCATGAPRRWSWVAGQRIALLWARRLGGDRFRGRPAGGRTGQHDLRG